ncbi:MAG: hypothetical protein IJU03_07110 [Thermoguttaceae bacterium]|nr:hypothetical protein [Thermoguttaceae bacterium]
MRVGRLVAKLWGSVSGQGVWRVRTRSQTSPEYRFALPTRVQWEYARRAGARTEFSYGDDPDEEEEYVDFRLHMTEVKRDN